MVFGGAFGLVSGVGDITVVGLASGRVVGGLLEGVLVWCGCGMGRLRCRFKIWCVMVAVGWRWREALVVVWVVCGIFAGCGCGCVVGLSCLGGRWWVDGGGDWLVGLAVWGRWRGWVIWVGVVAE